MIRLQPDSNFLGVVLVSTGVLKVRKPFAVWIRVTNLEFKFKRKRKFSVRSLVAAVSLKSLTA